MLSNVHILSSSYPHSSEVSTKTKIQILTPTLIPQMFHDLLTIPDPRPSKAHPDHRARRKEIESQFPHFDAKELGLKAGVLALMLGIACYPRIEQEKEKLEEAIKGSAGKHGRRREGRREGRSERKRNVGEERDVRKVGYGEYEGRSRRGSVGWERADYERRREHRAGKVEHPRDGYEGRLGSGIGRRR